MQNTNFVVGTINSENLRFITSFKRLIKGSDLSAFVHYYTARQLAAAQCIVISPVSGFCVFVGVCVFVGLLPQ